MAMGKWLLWQTHLPDQWQWCRTADSGLLEVSVQEGSLETAANMIGGVEAVVLLRGESLLIRKVELTVRNISRARQALPFRLADELLSDPDDLHFCLARCSEANQFDVVVVDRMLLRSVLARLSEAGVRVSAVYPDIVTLPWSESGGTDSVLYEPERCVVRTGVNSGYVISRDIAETFRSGLGEPGAMEQSGSRNRFAVKGAEPADSAVQGPLVVVDSPLQLFARGVGQRKPVNLLQGEFKPARALFRVTPVNVAACLVMAVLVVSAFRFHGLHLQYRYAVENSIAELEKISHSELGEKFRSTERLQQRLIERLQQHQDRTVAQPPFLQVLAAATQLFPPGTRLNRVRVTTDELEFSFPSEPTTQPAAALLQRLPGQVRFQTHNGESTLYWRLVSDSKRAQ